MAQRHLPGEPLNVYFDETNFDDEGYICMWSSATALNVQIWTSGNIPCGINQMAILDQQLAAIKGWGGLIQDGVARVKVTAANSAIVPGDPIKVVSGGLADKHTIREDSLANHNADMQILIGFALEAVGASAGGKMDVKLVLGRA